MRVPCVVDVVTGPREISSLPLVGIWPRRLYLQTRTVRKPEVGYKTDSNTISRDVFCVLISAARAEPTTPITALP